MISITYRKDNHNVIDLGKKVIGNKDFKLVLCDMEYSTCQIKTCK